MSLPALESKKHNTHYILTGGSPMRWEKPSFNDMRFGFEVTMYICNR